MRYSFLVYVRAQHASLELSLRAYSWLQSIEADSINLEERLMDAQAEIETLKEALAQAQGGGQAAVVLQAEVRFFPPPCLPAGVDTEGGAGRV